MGWGRTKRKPRPHKVHVQEEVIIIIIPSSSTSLPLRERHGTVLISAYFLSAVTDFLDADWSDRLINPLNHGGDNSTCTADHHRLLAPPRPLSGVSLAPVGLDPHSHFLLLLFSCCLCCSEEKTWSVVFAPFELGQFGRANACDNLKSRRR